VGGFSYSKYKKDSKPIEYETVKVKKGDLTRTVEATGKVQSTNDLSLRFELAGTLAEVKVIEGQLVKQNDLLAYLKLSELNASITKAKADLNQKLAGVTVEELNSLKAAMDNSKASLDKAKADAFSSVAAAESTIDTAKNNLKLAEGGDNSKIVNNEYIDAIALLHKTASVLDDALTQADNILAIDNKSANDDFDSYLSINDSSKLNIAESQYLVAKKAKDDANNLITPLTTNSPRDSIDDALDEMEQALSKINQLLIYVADVLTATPSAGTLTQTALNTKKTTISTTRSSLTAQYSSLLTQKQDISTAKNSYSSYKITYDKAVKELGLIKKQNDANTKIKEAAYNQAIANYKDKSNPPRGVDVDPYRAILNQAQVNRQKAILKSPMEGKVTKINKKKGEYISANEVMLEMSLANYLEIEVDIPETDIAKVDIGDQVEYTLDAFGDSKKFIGRIDSVDEKSTEIQDVVYYRVRIGISGKYFQDTGDEGRKFKPGLTANVVINTDSSNTFKNILYLPLRAVLTSSSGEKYVRVLKNNKAEDVVIKLGNRVDDGLVVVKSGVGEGSEVVLRVKK